MPPPLNDSPYLYGLHDPGGEEIMLQAGKPGWVLFTEAIGHDPNNHSGSDYTPWSRRGLGIIARLNNGYYPHGTIPHSSRYQAFARRCANFVRASRGCHIWIIGNEMNFAIERPYGRVRAQLRSTVSPPDPSPWQRIWQWIREAVGFIETAAKRPGLPGTGDGPSGAGIANADPHGRGLPQRFNALHPAPEAVPDPAPVEIQFRAASNAGQAITPEMYARCYRLCRDTIHSVPGHEADQVLVGAVAPWNNQTKYPGNPTGDWVIYFRDILIELGPDGCDGFALHTYTHQPDPNLIHADVMMGAPFQNRHFEFRAYQDFMQAVPQNMRHLPAYITETNQDVPWLDANIGWVQRAYGEIDHWNRQPGNQPIRALILYRYPRIDRWYIEGKAGVIEDFREALRFDYQWKAPPMAILDLDPGDIVRPTTTVNLRRTPGYRNQPVGDVLAQVRPDDRLRVLSGDPAVADDLIWWNVERIGDGVRGWVAESTPGSGAPLIETVEEAPPTRGELSVGGNARTLTAVNVRRSPGFRNQPPTDVLATLPQETIVHIIDGPRTVDGLVWWRVQTNVDGREVVGWTAQATSTGQTLLAPTPESVPQPAPQPPQTGLRPGAAAVTQATVRFRRTPGHLNQPPNDVIADVPPNTRVQIVGGPRTVDGLIWWEVEAPVHGRTVRGWMAQTAPNGQTLLAPAAGGEQPPDPDFAAGDLATTAALLNVRRSPGYRNQTEDDVLGRFHPGVALVVRGGPRQADDLTWWQVSGVTTEGRTVTGWVAQRAPGGEVLIRKPPPLPGTDITSARDRYLATPFHGRHPVTQLFGENPDFYGQFTYDGVPLKGHNALDFGMPVDTDLLAVDGGTVAQVGFDADGYGHYVLLRHPWGESLYAHMERVSVRQGQQVTGGQRLGTSGNTGASTGPHLHFGIRVTPYNRADGWGGFSDPLPYLDPGDLRMPSYLPRMAVRATGFAPPAEEGQPMQRLSPETPDDPRP